MEEISKKVKEFILEKLRNRVGDVEDKNLEENFIESGIIDSFGFLELLMSIEQKFNTQINFTDLDPSEFATLDGLTFHCTKAIENSKIIGAAP